jgi:predicted protein tyrosine phosphatase
MEDGQRKEICERFPDLYMQKRILSLKIPDVFHYNQPELVAILKTKMKEIEDLLQPHFQL